MAGFRLAACTGCGGVLKPDVVFFGENVPRDRVDRAYALVDALAADDGALLVAGSSLTVMSGLRFVRRARQLGVPVVIVNRGATRGDDLADVRVDRGCSETLTALAQACSRGLVDAAACRPQQWAAWTSPRPRSGSATASGARWTSGCSRRTTTASSR